MSTFTLARISQRSKDHKYCILRNSPAVKSTWVAHKLRPTSYSRNVLEQTKRTTSYAYRKSLKPPKHAAKHKHERKHVVWLFPKPCVMTCRYMMKRHKRAPCLLLRRSLRGHTRQAKIYPCITVLLEIQDIVLVSGHHGQTTPVGIAFSLPYSPLAHHDIHPRVRQSGEYDHGLLSDYSRVVRKKRR